MKLKVLFSVMFFLFVWVGFVHAETEQVKKFKDGSILHYLASDTEKLESSELQDLKANGVEDLALFSLKSCGQKGSPIHVWFRSGVSDRPELVYKVGDHHDSIKGEEFWIEGDCRVRVRSKSTYLHERVSIYQFDPRAMDFRSLSSDLVGLGEDSRVLKDVGVYAEESGTVLLTVVHTNERVKVLATRMSGADIKVFVKTRQGITGWIHLMDAVKGCHPKGSVIESLCIMEH